ncbi:Uncharacterised protein [Paenibacillus macerans]|nr:Uncharacterised protein [Paenibacillus macerans]
MFVFCKIYDGIKNKKHHKYFENRIIKRNFP